MKIIFFILSIYVFCFASFEDFQCGFDYGYRDEAKGQFGDGKIDKLTIVLIVLIKPVTPSGMTDYEFGVQYGKEAAKKRIYQRKNSFVKKYNGN